VRNIDFLSREVHPKQQDTTCTQNGKIAARAAAGRSSSHPIIDTAHRAYLRCVAKHRRCDAPSTVSHREDLDADPVRAGARKAAHTAPPHTHTRSQRTCPAAAGYATVMTTQLQTTSQIHIGVIQCISNGKRSSNRFLLRKINPSIVRLLSSDVTAMMEVASNTRIFSTGSSMSPSHAHHQEISLAA
jgi:hypothetical protein